ncbi:MAG TPA: hypothetical protein ENK55_04125 [Actinobacteria bacterium]|nr:hypothetical protein [Actinomycetota bacterium]
MPRIPVVMRILSANLYAGRAEPKAFGSILDEISPDVVCVQELDPENAAVLADRFPHVDLEPRDDVHGAGIAARVPFEAGIVPTPFRRARTATLRWEEAAIEVVGVHLANPVDPPWGQTAAVRRAQVAGILEHVAAVSRCVVVGDFNATPRWAAYRAFAEELVDLVVEAGVRPPATWGYRHALPRILRIDHAFGKGVRCTAARTLRLPRSDHDALVVDVVVDRRGPGHPSGRTSSTSVDPQVRQRR